MNGASAAGNVASPVMRRNAPEGTRVYQPRADKSRGASPAASPAPSTSHCV